jgi:hypothetical protein
MEWMCEFVCQNLITCQNHGNVLILNCYKSWVFPKFYVGWGHLELTMEVVIKAT